MSLESTTRDICTVMNSLISTPIYTPVVSNLMLIMEHTERVIKMFNLANDLFMARVCGLDTTFILNIYKFVAESQLGNVLDRLCLFHKSEKVVKNILRRHYQKG